MYSGYQSFNGYKCSKYILPSSCSSDNDTSANDTLDKGLISKIYKELT